jgi:thiol-disulfide isomerase/thioredoxin
MVKKSWIAALALTLAFGGAVAAEKAATNASSTAPAGKYAKPAIDTSQFKAAPEWSLADLKGKPLTSKELQGKVVLVDFWATWCGPCRRTIPHLIDLHNAYKDKGLAVVGVSLDQQGPSVVGPFVEKNKIPYTVVMGNQKVVEDFGGVRGIPTAFIISQDGKIVRKIMGAVPAERYENDIKALLGLS